MVFVHLHSSEDLGNGVSQRKVDQEVTQISHSAACRVMLVVDRPKPPEVLKVVRMTARHHCPTPLYIWEGPRDHHAMEGGRPAAWVLPAARMAPPHVLG